MEGLERLISNGVVVVAQLAERSLPTPDDRRSNPVIGKILFIHSLSAELKRRK